MRFSYSLVSALAAAGLTIAAPHLDTPSSSNLMLKERAPVCTTVPVFPPPPNALCGSLGRLQERHVLFRTHIGNAAQPLNTCRDMCLDHTSCLSFAYKASTRICRAFSSTLQAQGIHDTHVSNGNVFYSRTCFKQSCTRPPTSGCVSASLANPTAITDYSDGTADQSYFNSERFTIPLPFEVGYGAYKGYKLLVGLDGFAYTWDNGNPLSEELGWAPFYQQMQVDFGRDQGVFYEIAGASPNRIVKVQWKTTDLQTPPGGTHQFGVQNYNIILQLYENDPYKAKYSYVRISDDGGKAIAAIVDASGEYDYSLQQPGKLVSGLTLNVDNNDTSFAASRRPICA